MRKIIHARPVGYRQRQRLKALKALEDLRQRYGCRADDTDGNGGSPVNEKPDHWKPL